LDLDAVWGGEWVGLGMGVLTFGGDHRRGRGSLEWILCRNGVLIDDRLVCEKLTIFPYADYTVEFCVNYLSYDIVRYKIEVGLKRNSCAKT